MPEDKLSPIACDANIFRLKETTPAYMKKTDKSSPSPNSPAAQSPNKNMIVRVVKGITGIGTRHISP